MTQESRLEQWQRTGLLQLAVAGVVFATWVYFQLKFSAAERPIVLNDILLIAVSWLGLKVALASGQKIGEAKAKQEPELEPESKGRHAK